MPRPTCINPWYFAENRQTLTGALPAKLFERLPELTEDVHYLLQGVDDPHRGVLLTGEVAAKLDLVCQRCFMPVAYDVATPFTWLPVKTEAEAEQVGDPDLVKLVEQAAFDWVEALEEEILLALPMIALHADQQCAVLPKFEKQVQNPEAAHAFAALADAWRKH